MANEAAPENHRRSHTDRSDKRYWPARLRPLRSASTPKPTRCNLFLKKQERFGSPTALKDYRLYVAVPVTDDLEQIVSVVGEENLLVGPIMAIPLPSGSTSCTGMEMFGFDNFHAHQPKRAPGQGRTAGSVSVGLLKSKNHCRFALEPASIRRMSVWWQDTPDASLPKWPNSASLGFGTDIIRRAPA